MFNVARYLRAAIESVLIQGYATWELLLVDDCSTDDSAGIIREYARADDRIRLLSTEANGGAGVARNVALAAARGRLVAFLDTDDVWLPGKLERQLEFMRHHDSAFSFTKYGVISADGMPRAVAADIPGHVTYSDLLKRTVIGCSTVMLDLEKTGPARMPELRSRQDYVLWYSILKRGLIAHGLPEVLTLYRVVQGSVSRNKLKAAARMWRVYRRVERLGIISAAYYFCHYAYYAAFRNVRQRWLGPRVESGPAGVG